MAAGQPKIFVWCAKNRIFLSFSSLTYSDQNATFGLPSFGGINQMLILAVSNIYKYITFKGAGQDIFYVLGMLTL